jgi:hypothetical protein
VRVLSGVSSWMPSTASRDVKGDAYEGLLEKNAVDVKSGAGQYSHALPADPRARRGHAPRARYDHLRPGAVSLARGIPPLVEPWAR